jgi:hypothetical protein
MATAAILKKSTLKGTTSHYDATIFKMAANKIVKLSMV